MTVTVIKNEYCCIVQLRFTNGYELSMNIGKGGYNDNRDSPTGDEVIAERVECAVFDPDDAWVTQQFFPNAEDGRCSVMGWATMKDVEHAIKKIMEVKNGSRTV